MIATRPAALTILVLSLLAGTAQAQDLRNWCEAEARQMCGDYSIPLADCMADYDLWPLVPNECVGDLQTMIEMEREVVEEQRTGPGLYAEPRYLDRPVDTRNRRGFSYGGILRDGPGMRYPKLASLREHEEIEILEDTGVWFDGYKWFVVNSPQGVGYHWGGIFCTEGGSDHTPEGVLSSCH